MRRGAGGEAPGARLRLVRGHPDLLDGEELPQGEADLHLPNRHDPRRRAPVPPRGEGAARRGPRRPTRRRRGGPHGAAGGARGAEGRGARAALCRGGTGQGPALHRRDRAERELPQARRPGRGAGAQGLQPAPRPGRVRGEGRPGRRRRGLRDGVGDRPGGLRRRGDAELPQARLQPAQAGERRDAAGAGGAPRRGREHRAPFERAADDRDHPGDARDPAPPAGHDPRGAVEPGGGDRRARRHPEARGRPRGAPEERRGLPDDRPGATAAVLPPLRHRHRRGVERQGLPHAGALLWLLHLDLPLEELLRALRGRGLARPAPVGRPRRRGQEQPALHPEDLGERAKLLLHAALQLGDRLVRLPAHPAAQDPVRDAPDLEPDADAVAAPLPAAGDPPAVDGAQRDVRRRDARVDRTATTPRSGRTGAPTAWCWPGR